MKGFKRRNLCRKNPDGGGKRAALKVEVGAKSPRGAAHKTKVQAFAFLQFLRLGGGKQWQEKAANALGRHDRTRVANQGAIHAQSCWGAGDEDEVGSTALQSHRQKLVNGPLFAGLDAGCRRAIQFVDKP